MSSSHRSRVAAGLAASLLGLLPALPGQDAPAAAPDPAVGKMLFTQLCATCHGTTGKGDGPVKVEPKPRDLTSGKFSFGNTADAVFHTISRGIPPAMPGFEAALSEEHRRAITAFVMTLMPSAEASTPTQRKLRVGSRATVARGYLPPRTKNGLAVAHGLAIGLPGGLNAIYRTDDLRLLEVRRGDLLERTDWRGRGGTAVKLLGNSFFAQEGANPGARFAPFTGDGSLRARFAGTLVRGERAALRYRLQDDAHREVAELTEELSFRPTAGGLGLARLIGIAPLGRPLAARFIVGGLPDGTTLLHQDVVDSNGGKVARLVGKADGDELPHAWLVVAAHGGAHVALDGGKVRTDLSGSGLLQVHYLRTRAFTPALLDAVTAEIHQ